LPAARLIRAGASAFGRDRMDFNLSLAEVTHLCGDPGIEAEDLISRYLFLALENENPFLKNPQ
jgi:hypothetical protein